MAKLLAQNGVRVTIVTTPISVVRFGSILDQAIQSGLPICFLELPLQYTDFGLPEGCESVDDLPNLSYAKALTEGYASLQKEVEQYIEKLDQRPDCIVSDTYLLWPGETAKKFQIPRVIFDGMNCFTQLCNHIIDVSKVHESVGESELFVVPGLPDRIELTRSQLPFMFNSGTRDGGDFNEKVKISEAEAYGVVINSFQELETSICYIIRKSKEISLCIGSFYRSCLKEEPEKVQRGNKSSINKNECLKWLDSQEKGSVIYACLGSLSRIEPTQLVELALALEASKKPFIWVVRAGPKTDKIVKWIDEEGFEERTKERGLLIRGWAPQLLVLSHPAIGGFLTHCGWNSILEGVSAGVPMVTWLQFQEQFYNEKLIVQVLRIGVSVGAQNVVHFGEEEKSGVVVKCDEFKNAIETLMEEGEEKKKKKKKGWGRTKNGKEKKNKEKKK
ncbi:UDP-glycosyltransferase 73C6-like protein [Tanacetum coccineum]